MHFPKPNKKLDKCNLNTKSLKSYWKLKVSFFQILLVIIELWKGQHEYSVGGTQNASDAAGTLRFLALAKTFAHFCNKNAPLVSRKITTSWDVEGQMINVQKEYISLAFFAQKEKKKPWAEYFSNAYSHWMANEAAYQFSIANGIPKAFLCKWSRFCIVRARHRQLRKSRNSLTRRSNVRDDLSRIIPGQKNKTKIKTQNGPFRNTFRNQQGQRLGIHT